MNRRTVLMQLLGLGAVGMAVPALSEPRLPRRGGAGVPAGNLPFEPLPGPIPLPGDGRTAAQQRMLYGRIAIEDRLVLPEGYRSELLLSWGERLADGRFGFNNDYLAFTPLADGRALLTVNFEYIGPRTWMAGYREATGQSLPFTELIEALAARGGGVDAAALAKHDPLRAPLFAVAEAAMADLGIGVAEIRRDAHGDWRASPGRLDRRITGLNGWRRPEQRLRCSGPAAAVFRRRQRLGYDDGLGDQVIGSFANCAGGQTPWGTVLSAEENVQIHVVESVYADGSSPAPAERPFRFDGERLEGLGNPFGLAGNKYGWMVEVDPRRPELPAVKHTWLGRCRHEAVAVQAVIGRPLVMYSGCDRHGGHLYRFVSDEPVRDPTDPGCSRLLERGRLEAARFEADGTGRWLPLAPETSLEPQRPSHYARFNLTQSISVPHRDRRRSGAEALTDDDAVASYLAQYRTLADLYPGHGEEQQGAILIDAHLAANAVGATPAARPEDTEIDPRSGDLLIAFTAGGGDGDGRADPAIFHGPRGQASWPHGWVMRLHDGLQEGDAGGFRWRMVAVGGTPWQGGMGFANPDNLAIDRRGNLWMVTDRATGSSGADVFGNNACWLFPASGPRAGEALLFASGPMECELCGPCFDSAETTLFLAVQHPGESHGTHARGDEEIQAHTLEDRDGASFEQLRRVPLGSNWPARVPGRPPRPGVVAIRRRDGRPLLG
ncbi:MAG: alkaline phosphatase PhoX [Cyanobium sp.]|nr:alkaline phosphatase PhoX [Cyanobium sp.]